MLSCTLFGVEYQDSVGSSFLVTDLLLTCKKLWRLDIVLRRMYSCEIDKGRPCNCAQEVKKKISLSLSLSLSIYIYIYLGEEDNLKKSNRNLLH